MLLSVKFHVTVRFKETYIFAEQDNFTSRVSDDVQTEVFTSKKLTENVQYFKVGRTRTSNIMANTSVFILRGVYALMCSKCITHYSVLILVITL